MEMRSWGGRALPQRKLVTVERRSVVGGGWEDILGLTWQRLGVRFRGLFPRRRCWGLAGKETTDDISSLLDRRVSRILRIIRVFSPGLISHNPTLQPVAPGFGLTFLACGFDPS